MRQFMLGLIVAALAWWGYGKWTESEALANGSGGRVEAPSSSGGGSAGRAEPASMGALLGEGLADLPQVQMPDRVAGASEIVALGADVIRLR